MKSKDQILTKTEFESLWGVAKEGLDKIILVCAGVVGMRVSEIAGLETSWIDFQDMRIRIPTTTAKTDRSARAIPFRHIPRARAILESYFVLHDSVGISRQAISARVRKMAKRANLKRKITPHGLRATSAYRFAEAGLSGQALRQVMGWSQLSTAQYYIDATGHAAEVEIEKAFRDGRL